MALEVDSEPEFIPTIDFSFLSTSNADHDLNLELLELVGEHVMFALKNTGFLYLKNTGLTSDEVRYVNKVCSDFFSQSENLKQKFARGDQEDRNHGYVGYQMESLDPSQSLRDMKEAFNIVPSEVTSFDLEWPSDEFRDQLSCLYDKLKKIALRFLLVLATGLGQDVNLFTDSHTSIGEEGNPTAMRCLFYPPLQRSQLESSSVKQGQMRCGEHSDYGSITFLLSEDVGGLQVRNRDGNFVNITQSDDPSHILVNLGDLMQRWTDDELIAAKHRVAFNALKTTAKCEEVDASSEQNSNDEIEIVCVKRQSIAFFVHPDDATIVKSLKDQNKYPPISAGDYLKKRFKATYK